MAKFSFDDADDEAAAGRGVKRRRDDASEAGAADACANQPRNQEATEAEVAERGTGGAETAAAGGGGGGGEEDGISVRIDPDVLDCSICFEPLRPPLFQCQNGHVACSSCWSKLKNKCHICSHEANFTRNIALEKIVESIKSSCSYAKWGCCKMVSYAQRSAHEETCSYAPSPCPIPGCGYRGFTGWWSGHFLINHSADAIRFPYNLSFKASLEASVPFVVLLGEDDHLFLLLNKNATPFGHAFSVVCLRAGNLNWNFSCEVKVASRGNSANSLQMKSSVTNMKEWTGHHPADAFLLMPYDFCSSANLVLDVSIKKIRSSHVI